MDQAAITAKLRELELSLHRADIRRSRDRVAALLADDFVEFGSSGRVYDKAMIIELLARDQDNAPPPTVNDLVVRFLTPEVALVTYRAVATKRETLRSSLWLLSRGRWRMTFHQGTPTTTDVAN